MAWPSHWPSEVVGCYDSLASRFGWPESVIKGVTANVEYLRQLEESNLPRSYLQGECVGVRYLWEAVHAGAELIAVRQVEISDDGSMRRYSWRCREDDAGGLTDQPLEPAVDMAPLSEQEFASAWS